MSAEQTVVEPIAALAKSVHVIDTSRRVGWAKAFDAQGKLDEALHDVNMFRGDRDVYRKALSFMFGLFSSLSVDNSTASKKLLREAVESYGGVDVVLDDAVVASGQQRGESMRDGDAAWHEERELDQRLREQRIADKAIRSKASDREWKHAKESALISLAAHYGFPTIDEMHAVLEKFRIATHRSAISRDDVQRPWRRKKATP